MGVSGKVKFGTTSPVSDDYHIQLKSILTNTRLYTIWQACTLILTGLAPKTRPANLWELSY